MAIGLGQILGMGLLSQLMGSFGDKKEERPRMKGGWSPPQQGLQQGVMDVARQQSQQQQGQGNNQQQGFGGIGGMMSGVSNQLFPGMSPEQVAQLGIGFNSMRLRPDANVATALREKIASAQTQKQQKIGRERTAKALRGMVSEEYPNGRVELAEMVLNGVLEPKAAMVEAFKKEDTSDFMEKLGVIQDPESYGFSLSEDEKTLGIKHLLGVAISKADFERKIEFYNKMKTDGTLTPDMLALIGINKKDQPEFMKKMNELELLAQQTGMKPNVLLEHQLKILSGMTPDNGKTDAMMLMDYRAREAGLTPGTDAYKNFFLENGGGDSIDIDIDTAEDTDAYRAAVQKHMSEQDILQINGARDAFMGIQKLDQVLGVLEELGEAPGIAADWRLQVDRVMADLGLSKEAARRASYMQRLEALLGSDVFGMIKILGIGARGLDTPAERDFLISVMTGVKEMTPETIYQMTLYRRKYAVAILEEYNKRVNNEYFANYEKHARQLETYTIPEMKSFKIKGVDEIITQSDAEILRLYGIN